jgi:hypothetical protein
MQRMAVAEAVSTAVAVSMVADLADSTVVADFMAVALAGFTAVDFTPADFIAAVFTVAGSSGAGWDGLIIRIPGGVITRTMGMIMITANLTRRLGTTAPTRPAITLT